MDGPTSVPDTGGDRSTTTLDAGIRARLDRELRELREHAEEWARLPVAAKLQMVWESRACLGREADRWVDASVAGKGIDPTSPWVGEEWASGPWALAAGLDGYLETLEALASGELPEFTGLRSGPGGQLIVPVFPRTGFDRLLMSGITAEVWMQEGVTADNLREHMASFYRRHEPDGRLALVLGAGNVNSIAPMDALDRLLAHGEVVFVKMNPVNDYLTDILADVFEPFVAGGFLRIVSGGAEVGAYLTRHPEVDHIHITGSARTHDVIVFGPGEEGRERRRRGEPLLGTPITSELGGVGPVIVVPGPWSDADVAFHAENVVTMKLHNSGANCVAAQVLVLPAAWDRRDAFLDEVRRVMGSLPPRHAYYPGSAERQRRLTEDHPQAERFAGDVPRTLISGLDPAEDDPCFTLEAFAPVLAETRLPGSDPASFLANAVEFCNERLDGTLGATILVHPATARDLGDRLERAVADLRYGSIGVNVWNAVAFLLAQASWGAYPGHTLADIGSGIGVVHNTFLFDRPEKSVVRGSFRPFPRSWLHGDPALLPKPPWFVTNRTADATLRLLTRFAVAPGWQHIPGIFASALRG